VSAYKGFIELDTSGVCDESNISNAYTVTDESSTCDDSVSFDFDACVIYNACNDSDESSAPDISAVFVCTLSTETETTRESPHSADGDG